MHPLLVCRVGRATQTKIPFHCLLSVPHRTDEAHVYCRKLALDVHTSLKKPDPSGNIFLITQYSDQKKDLFVLYIRDGRISNYTACMLEGP